MLISEKKPCVCGEIRLKRLESYRERYWSDEKYRLEKIEKIKQRSKTRVACGSCKKDVAYGSMLAQSKNCRGFKEPSMLEMLSRV